MTSIAKWVFQQLPKPIGLGFGITLLVFAAVQYLLQISPIDTFSNRYFVIPASCVALIVLMCYALPPLYMRFVYRHLRASNTDQVGIWLAKIEGDPGDEYLRNLNGQISEELSSDGSLKEVELKIYPQTISNHKEAQNIGTRLNAKAIVWGSLGKDLQQKQVSNLKLTITEGPMRLYRDVQFRPEVGLSNYEMRNAARFTVGYALLSRGEAAEAVPHFDRILDEPSGKLFDLADAFQFGGIASLLTVQRSTESKALLEKSIKYFTRYVELCPKDSLPLAYATGVYNLGRAHSNLLGDPLENQTKALEYYAEAASVFGGQDDLEGQAMALRACANRG